MTPLLTQWSYVFLALTPSISPEAHLAVLASCQSAGPGWSHGTSPSRGTWSGACRPREVHLTTPTNKVWCQYNMLRFLENDNNRHPIAGVSFVMPITKLLYCTIFDHIITALDSLEIIYELFLAGTHNPIRPDHDLLLNTFSKVFLWKKMDAFFIQISLINVRSWGCNL